jgi:uracil-DNA glycosylase family 4
MIAFPDAVNVVLDHLSRSRESGGASSASAAVLARLAAAREIERPAQVAEASPIAPLAPPSLRPAAEAARLPLVDSEPVVAEFTPVTDPSGTKADRVARLRAIAATCQKCPHLAASRHSVVFGVGNPEAEVMFIGEAPGADEDMQGEPFVGKAGQLLTKIIETMNYRREDVYIANILKCRPDTPGQSAGNRPPTPEEMNTCLPYLVEQIEIIQPKVLVALGLTAAKGLLENVRSLGEVRGRWHDYRSIPLMVTFHPAYLLRNQAPSERRKAWEDMLLVKERLGHEITDRERRYFLSKS